MTSESDDIIDCMAQLKKSRKPFALATVIRTEDATAAKAGAKALIQPDGSVTGWVGGGCTLGAVRKAAAEALETGNSKLVHIKPAAIAAAETPVDGIDIHKSGCPSGGTSEVFVEPVLPEPALIIMGASSTAQSLCRLGRAMKFKVGVAALADDLAAFESVDQTFEGFDCADEPLLAGSFVVVATQGKRDRDALRSALSSPAAYVAFVGSRRKAEKLTGDLIAEGIDPKRVKALHSPAGLDIGAATPDEIALSILAEITQERRKKGLGATNPTTGSASATAG